MWPVWPTCAHEPATRGLDRPAALRELVRYRAKLVVRAEGAGPCSAGQGGRGGADVRPVQQGRPAAAGRRQARHGLPHAGRVAGELIDLYDHEIVFFTDAIAARLCRNPGYHAIQRIPGVGPTFAAIFVVEIGDVGRFRRPAQLACWAGMTPRHRESDTTVHRGAITKQGSRLVRWAAVEAAQRLPIDVKLRADRDRIAERRGKSIGKIAAARRLLTHVYYGLRYGHIRALAARPAA